MALGFPKFLIFEPFFTTKEWVREQGLDSIPVTKSLNGMGDIRVMARPGDTCFQVRLPSQSKKCKAKPEEQGTAES